MSVTLLCWCHGLPSRASHMYAISALVYRWRILQNLRYEMILFPRSSTCKSELMDRDIMELWTGTTPPGLASFSR